MPRTAAAPGAKPPRAASATRRKPAAATPLGWRRGDSDQTMIEALGQRLRAIREGKGLSLASLGELSAIPAATLSRIENSKMSPTFSVLARLMMALGVDWIDLVGPKAAQSPARPLVSFNEPGGGQPRKVRGTHCVVLHNDANAHAMTLLVDVRARQLEKMGGLVGHPGEEFCYVLSGTLLLHMQGREPKVLKAGGSALFDSGTPHAYVSGCAGGVRILVVVTRAYGSHMPQAAAV